MNSDDPAVRLRGVTKAYGPVTALDDVDLDLLPGEVHCLAGENGAGKSTLIKVLTGAVARDRGDYQVAGKALGPRPSPVETRDAGIGVVYQELSLLPDLSVLDNLTMGRFPRRLFGIIDRGAQRRTARDHLDRVGLGDLDLDQPVLALPTATRQLVEIARVLGTEAKLVIFDEPTTALSEREAAALLDRVGALRDAGHTVLYVTHRLEEMFEVGDRVTVLRDGRVVATRPVAEYDHDSLIQAMVGRPVQNLYPGVRHEIGPPRLEVRGLRIAGFAAPVDLSVGRGEIVGLAGLLGAGRSEIVRAVFGADPVEGGQVRVDGVEVPRGSPRAAARHGVALVTEDRKESGLLLQLSIEANVSIASLGQVSSGSVLRGSRERRHVQQSVEGLRLKYGSFDDPVTSLSGGNQQKVLLARWLATGAKVLLLDEPTKGVDVGAKADIYQAIAEMARNGLAVLVVSSYLPELLGLCDRIVVVREREVVGELPAAEATEEKILRLTSPLTSAADLSAPMPAQAPLESR
ncbi:sugar ABC transporter ATP-binding protein [Plantactinospora solaniradicis]|uniref:Sugar ABC transporter ATP-binding protein n=1 Tax=Plantactinospora solaniradicis TaxID=1723736 RepID=A0ABW1KL83_9ACTN